tara:strand:+ start:258 stop:689 length:432 start_codon:yes stop_codon:yes gene_type:complete
LFPAKYLGFEVKPNYDGAGDENSKDKKVAEAAKAAKAAINKKVNMFQMSRSQVNSAADLKSVIGDPIRKQVKLMGRIQFEVGALHHVDTYLRKHIFRDVTTWFYFGQKDIHEYFALSFYLKEKITEYSEEKVLMEEWITLDNY